MFDLILKGGTCATFGGIRQADVGLKNGKIAALGVLDTAEAGGVMDVSGLHVLPGFMDTHVHFCEPGFEHFEDLTSGTAGAALGGVTTVFDMPDTVPATATPETLSDKCRRAKDRVWCDIAFYVGANAANGEKLADLERAQAVCGLHLCDDDIDDATLTSILTSGFRRISIETQNVTRVLKLAKAVKRRVHFQNISCRDDLNLISNHKDVASVSCAIPSGKLWAAIDQGMVDCISSSHAPHLNEGLSSVQAFVPMMLNHVHQGDLSLEQLVELCCTGPARVFNIASKGRIAVGYDADFTVVDLKAARIISDHWMASKIGKTPYNGMKVTGWPVSTILRGQVVMHEGQLLDNPAGEAVRFCECL